MPGRELVAITIIPSKPIIRLGGLHTLDIDNMQRRLKYALENAGLKVVVCGIDFSYNEDQDSKYPAFWCPHFYLITSVKDKRRLKRVLKGIFKGDNRIRRPVKISDFTNSNRRRSYAFKTTFRRRIGIVDIKVKRDGSNRKCRNTSRDKLRAAERLELFVYLDQVGFAGRLIFYGTKPVPHSDGVSIKSNIDPSVSSYQARAKIGQKDAKERPKMGYFRLRIM